MRQVQTIDGDMVDMICRRHYGDETGFAELVYQANPGLADLGPRLPAGLSVNLPDMPTPPELPAISLWD